MATPTLSNITPPRVPLTDPNTGVISNAWYRFFLTLFNLTGGGANSTTLSDLQIGPPQNNGLSVSDISGLNNYNIPPSGITLTGSPFTYTNGEVYNVDVMISGGGISKLEFSRDGTTYYDTGSYYGMFALSPFDTLRVTYVSAPTMTLISR
jgi:hypothetical protein